MFISVADFAARAKDDARLVNRRAAIALAEAGAFDSLQPDRQLALRQFDLARGAHRRAAGKGKLDFSLRGEIDRLRLPLSLSKGEFPPAWSDGGALITDVDGLKSRLEEDGRVAVILIDATQKKTKDDRPYWILNVWLKGTLVSGFWWQDANHPFDHRLAGLQPGQRLLLWARARERNEAVQLNVLGLLDTA